MALYSNTQQVIRHYLSASVGDLIYGQCGATGTTTAIINAPFLWQPTDYYNEHYYEVYIYAGLNIGLTRRVTDWTLSTTHLLTVHAVYTADCDATSYAELHHIFSTDDYNKAIDLAIESVRESYLVPLIDETTIILASTTDNKGDTVYTYEYDLPTTMTHLSRVVKEEAVDGVKLTGTVSAGAWTAGETVDGSSSGASGEFVYDGTTYIRLRKVSGTFTTSDTATGATSSETVTSITAVASESAGLGVFYDEDEIDQRNWGIVKAYPSGTPSLKLNQSYISSFDEDLYLRLEGQMRQATLGSDDTAICYLPPDWVVQKAITFLPQNKIQSNDLDATYRNSLLLSAREPRSWADPMARSVME